MKLNASFPVLAQLVEGVDQLLTDYQIKDGHVILQLDSVSATSYPRPFPITTRNLRA